jgi:glutamate formiminotransferase/formiminotetrahydrofolate cyclodeaminase
MAASFTDGTPGGPDAAAAAERLRRTSTGLAAADVTAYERFVAARRRHGKGHPETAAALDGAVEVPMQVAAAAAELADLAAALASRGNPRLRGDASTSCWLAAAAASAASVLVAENLAAEPSDPRVAAAQASARAARAAAASLDR